MVTLINKIVEYQANGDPRKGIECTHKEWMQISLLLRTCERNASFYDVFLVATFIWNCFFAHKYFSNLISKVDNLF